jgi:hypothetical protein
MIKCNSCGTLHEESKEKVEDRSYLAFDDKYHYCKECAKQVNLHDLVILVAADKVKEKKS